MSNADKGGRTRFRKGQSANPGGRPKGYGNVRELAREYTEEAIEALVALMSDAQTRWLQRERQVSCCPGVGASPRLHRANQLAGRRIDKIKARANRPPLSRS